MATVYRLQSTVKEPAIIVCHEFTFSDLIMSLIDTLRIPYFRREEVQLLNAKRLFFYNWKATAHRLQLKKQRSKIFTNSPPVTSWKVNGEL
jgi:hypothetical protein